MYNLLRYRRYTLLFFALIFCVSASGFVPDITSASPENWQDETIEDEAPYTSFLPLTLNDAPGRAATQPVTQPTPTTTPDVPPQSEVRNGHATFYDATGKGSCMFDASPNDLMVGAINNFDYDNSTMCGAYVEVTGPEDVIMIRIVDRCGDDICTSGHIDLSAEAFDHIAEPRDGYVPITWRIVSPDIDGPIVYHFKDGSSQYWTAVQIRNHRNPVAKLEYLDSNGEFKNVERQHYNYFIEESGMGVGPYTFRVTDIYGNVITDSGIELVEDGDVSGNNQFPSP